MFDAFYNTRNPAFKNRLQNIWAYPLELCFDSSKKDLWRIEFKSLHFPFQVPEKHKVQWYKIGRIRRIGGEMDWHLR
jgi:hypothetical protein